MKNNQVVMPTFSWHPTTLEDCEELMKNLRDFSKDDLLIAAGDGEEGLRSAVAGSRYVYTGCVDGRVALIYGVRVINILSGHVYLWMMTTKLVEEYWVTFSRAACVYACDLLGEYSQVTAICPLRNKKSAKWLEFIGFVPGPVVRMHRIKFKSYMLTRETLDVEKLAWFNQGEDRWQPLQRSSV